MGDWVIVCQNAAPGVSLQAGGAVRSRAPSGIVTNTWPTPVRAWDLPLDSWSLLFLL